MSKDTEGQANRKNVCRICGTSWETDGQLCKQPRTQVEDHMVF